MSRRLYLVFVVLGLVLVFNLYMINPQTNGHHGQNFAAKAVFHVPQTFDRVGFSSDYKISKDNSKPLIEGVDPQTGYSVTFKTTIEQYLRKTAPQFLPLSLPWEKTTNITLKHFLEQREDSATLIRKFSSKLLDNFLLTPSEFFHHFTRTPKGPTFVCQYQDTQCETLRTTLKSTGAKEITKLFESFFPSPSNAEDPLAVQIWCLFVAGAHSRHECLLSAMIRSDSLLGDLRFVQFSGASSFRTMLDQISSIDNVKKILFLDQLMPVEWAGDKAVFSIALVQQASLDSQRKISTYFPRSYYISTPCNDTKSTSPFDQWNLWLEDFYSGSPPPTLVREILQENSSYKGDTFEWKKNQNSITLGSNLWVSKPVGYDLYTNGSISRSPNLIHVHAGNAIRVFRSPDELNALAHVDNEMFGSCVGNHRVVQKYVEQPLLLDGKKADIRIYVLVLSLDPVEAYIQSRIIPVRQARKLYNESNSDDRSHITNQSKAAKEDNLDIHKDWTEYRAALADLQGLTEADVEDILFSRIKFAVRSTLEMIPKSSHRENSSAFMGWDIILDKHMNPWVMEANIRPDMRAIVSNISKRNPQVINSALELVMLKSMKQMMPKSFYSWLWV